MSDRACVGLAMAVALGAWLSQPVASGFVLAALAVAALWRRPVLVVIGGCLLASWLGARAWAGTAPPRVHPVHTVATLLSDPESRFGAVRAVVRVEGHHYELWTRGAGARVLRPLATGERIEISGVVGPAPASVRARLAAEHVAGRIQADSIVFSSAGPWVAGAANRFRALLGRGAVSLPRPARSLLSGLVIGDDRDQAPEVIDAFRAAGLSHLLAVSGENVAFVLAVASPVLRRLRLRARLLTTVGLLAGFGVVTRFEPSVLRALVMAGLAAGAVAAGRPASGLRRLALAVVALVLVDPMLVHSLGFELSVGASLGIILLANRLAAALPGPGWLTGPLALTIAAQLGVAPASIPAFGGLPVAAIPANLLAVPFAGPVMMWGLTGGVLAGVLGGRAAAFLHWPTHVALAWIAFVADRAAGWPLGSLGPTHVVALGGCAWLAIAASHPADDPRRHRLARVALVAGALVLVEPAVAANWPGRIANALTAEPIAPGALVWRAPGSSGAVVVVVDRPDVAALLGALRARRIGHVDLLVARSPARSTSSLVATLEGELDVGLAVVPRGVVAPGALVAVAGQGWTVGPFAVQVTAAAPRLDVTVERSG